MALWKNSHSFVLSFVAILAGLGVAAHAEDAPDGKELYKTRTCVTCHGKEGAKAIQTYPQLAGLNQAYLYAQIKDIADGKRVSGPDARGYPRTQAMKDVMVVATDDELKTIAAWLSTLPPPPIKPGDAAKSAEGGALYAKSGSSPVTAPRASSRPPALRSSAAEKGISALQITEIRDGVRTNGKAKMMAAMVKRLTDADRRNRRTLVAGRSRRGQMTRTSGSRLAWKRSGPIPMEKIMKTKIALAMVSLFLMGSVAARAADTAPAPKADAGKVIVDEEGKKHEWMTKGGERDKALLLTPNLEHGKDVYEVCSGCHLPEGWGRADGTFPELAGQHRTVLIKQLTDIREGNRDNPTMYPFALTSEIGGEQSVADVTEYISRLPMNPENGVGPGTDLALGQKLYADNASAATARRAKATGTNIIRASGPALRLSAAPVSVDQGRQKAQRQSRHDGANQEFLRQGHRRGARLRVAPEAAEGHRRGQGLAES